MSNREPPTAGPEVQSEDEPSKGPNLVLLYSLLIVALLLATGFAALIVLPFYHRH
jgi:hypothetical protein